MINICFDRPVLVTIDWPALDAWWQLYNNCALLIDRGASFVAGAYYPATNRYDVYSDTGGFIAPAQFVTLRNDAKSTRYLEWLARLAQQRERQKTESDALIAKHEKEYNALVIDYNDVTTGAQQCR